jgi:hypothetical protein
MMTEQDRHRLDRILSSLEGLVATVQDIVSRLDVKECATPKSPSTTPTQPLRQAPALSPQQQQQRRHNETRELQEENTLKQDNFSNEKNNGLPNSDDAKEESAVMTSEALQNLAPSNEGNDGHTLKEDSAQKLSIIARSDEMVLGDEAHFREAFMAAVSGINEGVANDSGNIDLRDKCQDQAVAALHDEQNAPGCYVQLFFGKAEVSIIAKCEDSVLGDEKQFRGAFATAASGVDEDKTNDPVCGNLGDTCCEQSLQALHDEVSSIGIPVDFISYSNGDYEDGTRFGSEKQLDKLLPEARPSAACIALDRYKVWRQKRGKYYPLS